MLGFLPDELLTTPSFRFYQEQLPNDGDIVFKARVMAFALATWKRYASQLRNFQSFCRNRNINPLECTPSTVNVFLLRLGQTGATSGCVDSFLAALSFIYRFYLITDTIVDSAVLDVKKFLGKACPKHSNKKCAFGSDQIRQMWDKIDEKRGGVEFLSPLDLRTFVLAVFQHSTFCRYSDVAQLKLADLCYDLDYFKIKIQYSKTDQQGIGQVTFLAKSSSQYRDPHMLMCLYLSSMHSSQDDSVFLFPPLQ